MIPRLLFALACLVSLVLIALVILAPLGDNGETPTAGWAHMRVLFARDAALRRTAVASALGLMVTALVFFRPRARPAPRRRRRTTAPPPPSVAGA
jgi:hypothetical protein